jgi:crotonobetainyl-CoA:carnitine CoA-transferase CaiB-like acyl-CoA transferase
MLAHRRVLDLTDGGASIAGRILSDLGADVVLVEPKGGAASRLQGPWADGREDPEHSLEFWASHRGKRSWPLDLDHPADRDRLRDAVRGADVWIDDRPVGALDAIGLGEADLAAIQPRLVHCSITPFGGEGPKSRWSATDFTVTAASSTMHLTGDADRPPLACSVPQAFLHAGAEAAAAVMVALEERERSGFGQHVDVSAQTAMMATCQSNVLAHGWNDESLTRCGGGVSVGPYRLRFIYACRDGFVNFTFLFGEPIGHATQRFFDWMDEEGFSNDALRAEEWVRYGAKIVGGSADLAEHEAVMDAVERFTRTKTKAELFSAAFERRLLIVPLSDSRDLVDSRQLAARRFWTPMKQPPLDREVMIPGPFARFSETPIGPRGPAPRLSDAARTPWASPPDERPRPATPGTKRSGVSETPRGRALEGLKVLDFTWVYAGPAATRMLADHGATLVKIESSSAPDALRAGGPFKDRQPGPNRSANFGNVNLGKRSLGLNLKVREARALALRLVDWADVVVENFSPRAMKGWGLDYETLRERKPDLVMLSTSLSGGTGPEASLAGYGTMGSALAGFGFVTGWPDRRPAAPYVAYTDYVSPRFAVAALLAAVEHRRRTGVGQHIDLSQAECSIHFLGAAILDQTVNGHVWTARGNDLAGRAPRGVYPVRGEDRWIAIEAPDEVAWRALAAVAAEGWEDDPRFTEAHARFTHRAALDEALARWTARHEVEWLEERLQSAAVPAHRVTTSRDAFEDPQLRARPHFVEVDHPGLDRVPYENCRAILSATPGRPGPCPTLGQHNAEVLTEILGLGDEEIAELVIAGAVE